MDYPPLHTHIQQFLEYLEIEKNASALTVRAYRGYLKRFQKWLKNNGKEDITAEQIDAQLIREYRLYLNHYIDQHGNNLKRVTQGYYVIALRSFLKWLTRQDFKVLAPEKIELPKTESRSLKFLSAEQVNRLLDQPHISTEIDLRDKAILEVLFSTGLRVSELVSLNRDQVNLKTREFGVIGKGRRSRIVFLSQRSEYWLERYLTVRHDDWQPVFIRYSRGKDDTAKGDHMRLTPRTIQRIVKKYVKKAKLPVDATTHTLRHSFATDLLMHGADLRSVQEMLGHKNVATTQIYTHVTNPQLKKIHDKFHGTEA